NDASAIGKPVSRYVLSASSRLTGSTFFTMPFTFDRQTPCGHPTAWRSQGKASPTIAPRKPCVPINAAACHFSVRRWRNNARPPRVRTTVAAKPHPPCSGDRDPVFVLKRLLLVFVATIGFACAIVLIALATFAAPTASAQLTGRTQLESLQQGDLLRSYRQYTPAEVAQHPGVIFVLQGASGGMKAAGLMEAITGLDREADRLHWLVVYPDAA